MKILKIFGVVAGIHLFALILIFANPGCSSTTKPPPAPFDTVSHSPPAPAVRYPPASSSVYVAQPDPSITFNPDAPAVAASSSDVRFMPTRPGSPAAGTLLLEPVTDVLPASTHTVVSGDNLWNLARKHKVTVAELAAVNKLTASAILRPGQKLIIPSRPASPTFTATASPVTVAAETTRPAAVKPPPVEGDTHVVRPGETLGSIARRYGVRQGDIAVANNITDPQKIRAGTELIVPGWQAPAATVAPIATRAATGANGGANSASRTPEPKPAARIAPAPTVQPQELPAEVPVIRVDDSPISPVPNN
jgi:LysM repeat protein